MKILIIKLGYSETLDPEVNNVTSLGDVLRTTPLLRALKDKYPDSNIAWLTDKSAVPLLYGIPELDRILEVDAFVPFQLMREQFDIVVNLEKHPGVCAMADSVNAWAHYGFRFDVISGKYLAYEKGQGFLEYIKNKNGNGRKVKPWQQNLIEMLDLEWKEQSYLLGIKTSGKAQFDVGLNHMVGSKWPTKKMPEEHWKDVSDLLEKSGLKVSWQQGLNNLNEYAKWISSCKLILSQDSLGLHLALALKKNVVGLFGPTDPSEVFYYRLGKSVVASNCNIMPCGKSECLNETHCMAEISVSEIVDAVFSQLKKKEQNAEV